jgi:Peptidase family M3
LPELTLERLRKEGNSLMEEISREFYLAHAGFKPDAELVPIYARHATVVSADALSFAREAFQRSRDGTEDQRGARILLDFVVDTRAQRALAPHEEREIAWESSAIVRLADGRTVPYARAAIEIGNTADRRERSALDTARAALVEAELAPLRLERFQREIDLTAEMDIAPGYNATFEALSGISLTDLQSACEGFLRDTADLWRDLLAPAAKRSLGLSVADLMRADALALFRAPQFDRAFPGDDLEPSVRKQMSEMTIDPDARGRITFDVGEREGKRARAFCAPVRVPEEVYLVLRPHGGQSDYMTLLHELGHAVHFAYTRADYPFEYRWAGDSSVTEAYAMLFDHLTQNRGWLARYTGLGRELSAYLRAAALEELHFLRRYTAKLIYEVQLYGGQVSWTALPDLFVDTLSGATSFRYSAADAFVDVDPRYYSSRYLRAWQLGAVLAESLVDRFDVDWYRNPRTGPWLTENLFAEGQRETADEVAQRVSGRALSFAPVIKALEGLLA